MEGLRVVRVAGTSIVVVDHDGVGEDRAEEVLEPLKSVYSVEGPDLVELHLYRDLASLSLELSRAGAEAGVVLNAFFPVAFEAWSGVPRVHVAVRDALETLGGRVYRVFLVHEAVHSILHGGVEYYVLEYTGNPLASYLAATSLKDLEVHGYMALKGFTRELAVLKEYWAGVLGSVWQPYSIEEFFDVLRAATVWVALGEEPPATGTGLGRVFRVQARLLEEWRSRGVRPWEKRLEYAGAVEELLESTGLAQFNRWVPGYRV